MILKEIPEKLFGCYKLKFDILFDSNLIHSVYTPYQAHAKPSKHMLVLDF